MAKHKKRKKRGKYGGTPMADTADRHALYEESVQGVDHEVEFLQETYREIRGRNPVLLREDFCGTANAACEWIRAGAEHRAIGVDLDADVLDYGRKKHVAKLKSEQQGRVALINGDVLLTETEPADVLVAFNFSYFTFKTRDELRRYFEAARRGIKQDGMFVIDIYGGSEAYSEMEEETDHDSFTYVWDQDFYDPLSNDYRCYIHFRFPDGSEMKKAYTYEWRLWSVPEVRELLVEAGFAKTTVYWEGSDEDGDGDGVFEPAERGEADQAFVCYIVSEQ